MSSTSSKVLLLPPGLQTRNEIDLLLAMLPTVSTTALDLPNLPLELFILHQIR